MPNLSIGNVTESQKLLVITQPGGGFQAGCRTRKVRLESLSWETNAKNTKSRKRLQTKANVIAVASAARKLRGRWLLFPIIVSSTHTLQIKELTN